MGFFLGLHSFDEKSEMSFGFRWRLSSSQVPLISESDSVEFEFSSPEQTPSASLIGLLAGLRCGHSLHLGCGVVLCAFAVVCFLVLLSPDIQILLAKSVCFLCLFFSESCLFRVFCLHPFSSGNPSSKARLFVLLSKFSDACTQIPSSSFESRQGEILEQPWFDVLDLIHQK